MSDGTTYAIDIATRMTGGDASAESLDRLASALGDASTATQAAEAELANATARYAELEKSAVRAWNAAEKAAAKGSGDLPQLVANLQQAKTNLDAQAVALTAVEGRAKAAATAEGALAKQLERVKGEAAAAAKAPRALGEQLEKVSSVLGRFGGEAGRSAGSLVNAAGSVSKLTAEFGFLPALALGATAAIVALTGAAIAGAVALAKWAITLADSRRDAALSVEALEHTSDRLRGIGGVMPQITRDTGVTADALTDLAKQLDGAKVSADDMPTALNAVATAEAALGKGGASKFIADMQSGKKSVAEVAAEVESKFGGIVARKMIGLTATSEKFKRGISDLFGNLKIEAVLESLSRLADLFDKDSASGQTLRFLFETLVQPLIDRIPDAIDMFEAMVLGIEIGALKAYIAFKTIYNAIDEIIDLPDLGGEFDWLETVAVAAEVFTGVVIGMGVALAALTAALLAIPAAFAGLIYLVGEAAALGGDLIAGIVKGIDPSKVIEAITGAVGGAINAAKKLLGIASPSKVFEDIGENTALGFAGGVEDGSADAHAAVEGLASARPGAAAAPGAAGGVVVHLTINANPGESNDSLFARARDLLTDVFETDALTVGTV